MNALSRHNYTTNNNTKIQFRNKGEKSVWCVQKQAGMNVECVQSFETYRNHFIDTCSTYHEMKAAALAPIKHFFFYDCRTQI